MAPKPICATKNSPMVNRFMTSAYLNVLPAALGRRDGVPSPSGEIHAFPALLIGIVDWAASVVAPARFEPAFGLERAVTRTAKTLTYGAVGTRGCHPVFGWARIRAPIRPSQQVGTWLASRSAHNARRLGRRSGAGVAYASPGNSVRSPVAINSIAAAASRSPTTRSITRSPAVPSRRLMAGASVSHTSPHTRTMLASTMPKWPTPLPCWTWMMTVLIAPGPASSGIPRGTTPIVA
jgi:hypothetical protein